MIVTWWLPNGDCPTLSTQSTFTSQPSPFIYWFITGMDFWITIAFQWIKTHYCICYFGAQIIPRVGSCDMRPSSSSAFLYFWHNKIFQAHLVPVCSSLGVSPFSKEPWFLLVGNGVRGVSLDVFIAPGYLCLLVLSAERLKTICMYRCTHSHTHKWDHKHREHIYTHITKIMISHWYFHRVHFFAILHTYTSLISQWKPRLSISHNQY